MALTETTAVKIGSYADNNSTYNYYANVAASDTVVNAAIRACGVSFTDYYACSENCFLVFYEASSATDSVIINAGDGINSSRGDLTVSLSATCDITIVNLQGLRSQLKQSDGSLQIWVSSGYTGSVALVDMIKYPV